MEKATCERCKQEIDLNKDLHVSLGTHDGKTTTDMRYFHFNCWRQHFEEKARQKAEAVVNNMQERMKPIAKQMIGKLTDVIGSEKNLQN